MREFALFLAEIIPDLGLPHPGQIFPYFGFQDTTRQNPLGVG
jgi:hypothetical protein